MTVPGRPAQIVCIELTTTPKNSPAASQAAAPTATGAAHLASRSSPHAATSETTAPKPARPRAARWVCSAVPVRIWKKTR